MTGDRLFGLGMIVLALGYILSATHIQTSFMSDPVGPRIFPLLVAGVVIICALSMTLRPDPEADWPALKIVLQLAFCTAVLLAYGMSIRPAGFLLPTILASGVISYQINPRPATAIATGLGMGIGLFVLFKFILGLGLVGLPPAFTG